MLLCLLLAGVLVAACNNDDDGDPSNLIQLNSFGPSPALRGGELKFIGKNLDKVTAIVLPGSGEITSFVTKTPQLVVIEIPEATTEGKVILKTPNGEIETLTVLGISEPISITSISPAVVRPGETITIEGTYLNLIEQIVFASNKAVSEFESQSKTKMEVKVPVDAETGPLVLFTGVDSEEEIPIEVESESPLVVTLPQAVSLTPNTLRPGVDMTIAGTDLDLATTVVFPGGTRVDKEDFTITEEGEIVVTVPANAEDGNIILIAESLVETESADPLTMVVPTINSVSPNPGKTGNNITVTGADLDLITSVSFSGQTEGEGDKATVQQTNGEILEGGTATQIIVKIPTDATEGVVNFHTDAKKTVSSEDVLTLVKPAISSISPLAVETRENITITGSNLDIVEKVIFQGNIEGEIVSSSETELVVKVSPKSLSGKVTLIATNSVEVISDQFLDIEFGIVPTITSVPEFTKPGQMITIEGTDLHLTVDVIFPENVKATSFGLKSATKLEVVVPADAEIGIGKIKLVTTVGEFVESPEINIEGEIAHYIYDEALNTAHWDQWGGWDLEVQDVANTEQPKRGSKAIKLEFKGEWGAYQLHPKKVDFLEDYDAIVVSIYGTIEGTKMAIVIAGVEKEVVLKAGEYTTFEILLSEFGDLSDVSEVLIKNFGTAPNTVYVDDLGLR